MNATEWSRSQSAYPQVAYGDLEGHVVAAFVVPDGCTVQAYCFALDPTPAQAACLRRHFGGRRYARNWAVRTLKEDLARYHQFGEEMAKPSLAALRKRWNQVKDAECVDTVTGRVWWRDISKEAFADGIKAGVDAYWNWQTSRSGKRAGRRVGFPRFAKKGRDRDRVTFTTGGIRIERDRRHVTLPRVGTVRTHENTRRLERLIGKGRARILAVTVSRRGLRLVAAFRVLIQRPQPSRSTEAGSRVGVDVGVRVLATVANKHGQVIERVSNPRPLNAALKELRHLGRERSRRTPGSRGYRVAQRKITQLQRRVANVRAHHIHVLTTRLAKSHGEIVVEGLNAAGMLRQKGMRGARARRRGLSDAAPGETRRQLAYKVGWYGSSLVVADRWYPSSKTCHVCGQGQDIGLAEQWTCTCCGARHQRDDNAAINLARYEPPATGDGAVGPVGAAVKRGADRKTGPRPAGGREARKRRSRKTAEQPRDGVPVG